MIYKLQIWLENEGSSEWRDLYFDVSKITGFFLFQIKMIKCLMIMQLIYFFDGDLITIKQEPHILNYLQKEFGDKAIKPD